MECLGEKLNRKLSKVYNCLVLPLAIIQEPIKSIFKWVFLLPLSFATAKSVVIVFSLQAYLLVGSWVKT